MRRRVSSILLLTLTALSLAACGLRGELERPPPLWGDPQDYEESETADTADEDGR
ncbi:LPS translocon maturation chaperone LptM [Maricaulis parjimensis]|uniref:LPS translocon maturation chaperone LptM n=1 Tax=Maricaulis parjimensis TaxID=144023 RepID=UPI001939C76C|nr:lipoprotein [Maricaulis parjimensis]